MYKQSYEYLLLCHTKTHLSRLKSKPFSSTSWSFWSRTSSSTRAESSWLLYSVDFRYSSTPYPDSRTFFSGRSWQMKYCVTIIVIIILLNMLYLYEMSGNILDSLWRYTFQIFVKWLKLLRAQFAVQHGHNRVVLRSRIHMIETVDFLCVLGCHVLAGVWQFFCDSSLELRQTASHLIADRDERVRFAVTMSDHLLGDLEVSLNAWRMTVHGQRYFE